RAGLRSAARRSAVVSPARSTEEANGYAYRYSSATAATARCYRFLLPKWKLSAAASYSGRRGASSPSDWWVDSAGPPPIKNILANELTTDTWNARPKPKRRGGRRGRRRSR